MLLDTGFRPSQHGLTFPNTWRDMVFGAVKSRGRCGGMVFAALDHFLAGVVPPAGSDPGALPVHDSPLARYIWRRQIGSLGVRFGANLWRFALLTYLPSAGPQGVAAVTRRELLPLFDSLRAGRPAPLGMVSAISLRHLVRNHQVLAYAAEFGERRVTVRIYDPNHPRRDDIVLDVPIDPSGPVIERIGARVIRWRGFFVSRYRSQRVPSL
jgi:hypothetical protein